VYANNSIKEFDIPTYKDVTDPWPWCNFLSPGHELAKIGEMKVGMLNYWAVSKLLLIEE
jgi:hypothetical protein